VAGGMIVGHLGMGDIAGVLAQLKRWRRDERID
jgi:hypothetical protein